MARIKTNDSAEHISVESIVLNMEVDEELLFDLANDQIDESDCDLNDEAEDNLAVNVDGDSRRSGELRHGVREDTTLEDDVTDLDFEVLRVRFLDELDELNELREEGVELEYETRRLPEMRSSNCMWMLKRLNKKDIRFEWTMGKQLYFKRSVFGAESDDEESEDEEGESEGRCRFSFDTEERLDLIHVEGLPYGVLIGNRGDLAQVSLSCFRRWYGNFPMSSSLQIDFDVNGRTFQLGNVGGLQWFIVMKPNDVRVGCDVIGQGTCISASRALKLNRYLLWILKRRELIHLGFTLENCQDRGWQPTLSVVDFRRLQRLFVEHWDSEMKDDESDDFWLSHCPTFHCILIGNDQILEGTILLLLS